MPQGTVRTGGAARLLGVKPPLQIVPLQEHQRLFRPIAFDPAMDRAASHTRAFGDHDHRLAFCNFGNRTKASLESRGADGSKRSRSPLLNAGQVDLVVPS
jgi:hypothetical protein